MNERLLAEAFLTRLRAFIRRRAASAEDADDILQETLLRYIEHGTGVDDERSVAWIFTVARRLIADRYRRPAPAGVDVADFEDVAEAKDQATAMEELAVCVTPLLEQLEANDRALIERVDLRGESQQVIAHEEGVPYSTIKARVQRARARFRDRLALCCALVKDQRGVPIDYEPGPDSPCGPCESESA